MADPKPRSKKHSVSNKLRKGFTLYLCHNLDFESVAKALDRAGIRYKRHRQYFSGETEDTTLLPKVGQNRWILITFDQKQRTRSIEAELIKRYKIREFVFTSNEIGDVGAILVKACKKMRGICRRREGPFVYSISKFGNLAERVLK